MQREVPATHYPKPLGVGRGLASAATGASRAIVRVTLASNSLTRYPSPLLASQPATSGANRSRPSPRCKMPELRRKLK